MQYETRKWGAVILRARFPFERTRIWVVYSNINISPSYQKCIHRMCAICVFHVYVCVYIYDALEHDSHILADDCMYALLALIVFDVPLNVLSARAVNNVLFPSKC